MTSTSRWYRCHLVMCLLVLLAAECGLGQVASKPAAAGGQGETVTVFVGSSRIVRSPWPVARVSVTAPKVADVQVLTPSQVLLMGKSVGSTDLLLWSKTEEVWQARVEVLADVKQLNAEMARLFPDCKLEAVQSGETVVISGTLARAQQTLQLRQLLEASGLKFVDMTRLSGVQQVQLQVRLAEVSRTAIRALGLNAFEPSKDFFWGQTLGSAGGTPLNPVSIGPPAGASAAQRRVPFLFTNDVTVNPSVTLFAGFPRIGLEFFLQALSENQYMRILAEPRLVALSGEEASFLAGGEFPIPVVQGTTAGGGTTVTIEYREFGVRLRFRPTVLGDGGIRLYVAPEVSELSDINAVEFGGFRVPSIVTRRAETTLEMKNGQTFGMAGLLNRTNSGRATQVPGLGDVPVLGALFRSVRYSKSETELVMLVTVALVEPMSVSGPLPVPGLMHSAPDDWELYALGKIEGQVPARISPADAAWLQQMGLSRLKGPGAWTTYESGVSRSRSTARAMETYPVAVPASRPAPTTNPRNR